MGLTGDGGPVAALLRVRVDQEPDVFAARQLAREIGAAVGLDGQDQVRFATAISEVGRDALVAGGAWIDFAVRAPATLVATVTADQPLARAGSGLVAAGRLVDLEYQVDLEHRADDGGTAAPDRVVTLAKRIPPGLFVKDDRFAELRRSLAAIAPNTPADELRVQNNDLVAALTELRDKQDELLRLNAELEETNRGVLALYNQLSTELEETNRGVVALYAELDERGIALTRANEAKTRFLRSVSHELRSPVNSVLGLARLLLDPAGEPLSDEQRRQVEFILASSGDLLALVNDLLDLAKAESGRLDAVVDQVDVGALLRYLEGSLRPLATRPEVSFAVDTRVDVGLLTTDETLLARVLRNLVSNALKFTERGEVLLTARRGAGDGDASGDDHRLDGRHPEGPGHPAEDTVVFSVRDTGIGIAPDDLDRIFEEFYQVRTPLHARVRGTGLGLPYARRVIMLLGGRLEVVSEPGRGSTFTVTLPRRPAADTGLGREDADFDEHAGPLAGAGPAAGAPAAHVARALVVDDDPAFRATMRSLLADRVERIVEAGDGGQAIAALRADPPDVIFLDLMLPDMDGAAVLAAMSDDPALRDIPVVIVSWSDYASDVVEREHGRRRDRGRAALGPAVAVVAKSTLSGRALDAALARVHDRGRS
ncbi:response regulator [Frankia sp. CNm7]|uniref:histidine kinase n=1 Tax=Frankia nepalensis TaxID=1836974 RepID=A0A937RJF6_9ACTN|nr:ATP-binding protein [Frankia nepalensis]MBL7497881.1 response regulator [Frankia nepalensis]MBL7514378.1 response regulator [Frankia nepalensis]MBL7523321.1 response regulator [Frankia nepalensis]MBL7628464.1 response regulator [Frankia nepalensis]